MVLVDLVQGQVLHEPGRASPYVYFPTSAVISLLHATAKGETMEVGMVGHEGLVGISAFMGGSWAPAQAVVQISGKAWQAPAAVVREASEHLPVLALFLRYTQALITLMSQTATCNRHHSLEQRLCRLLLSYLDRIQGTELTMTHELIAMMLGMRREGVTQAALKLQQLGLIRYARGHIELLDRHGLEQRSCECYGVANREYRRLLPGPDCEADGHRRQAPPNL